MKINGSGTHEPSSPHGQQARNGNSREKNAHAKHRSRKCPSHSVEHGRPIAPDPSFRVRVAGGPASWRLRIFLPPTLLTVLFCGPRQSAAFFHNHAGPGQGETLTGPEIVTGPQKMRSVIAVLRSEGVPATFRSHRLVATTLISPVSGSTAHRARVSQICHNLPRTVGQAVYVVSVPRKGGAVRYP